MEKFRNRPKNGEYSSNTHMDNKTDISIAVMKTDIDYIKKAVDSMGRDIRDMKGMFLPLAQAATKEEVRSVREKVELIYRVGWVVGSLVITAVVVKLLSLVVIH
jgi:hypothetical protein